jgi:hypothetical protein
MGTGRLVTEVETTNKLTVNRDSLCRRLEGGEGVSAVFSHGSTESLINIWKLGARYILTWEEAPQGRQFDESQYTKDERHEFQSAEEIPAFLKKHSIPLDLFKP